MRGFWRESAGEKVAVGASFTLVARQARKGATIGLEEPLESALGVVSLTVGERFRKRRLNVFFGKSEEAKVLFDACGAPAPTLGARPGEITSEGGVVDVAPLSKILQGLFDLVGWVAGARHLLGELALAMSAARQAREREISRRGVISRVSLS